MKKAGKKKKSNKAKATSGRKAGRTMNSDKSTAKKSTAKKKTAGKKKTTGTKKKTTDGKVTPKVTPKATPKKKTTVKKASPKTAKTTRAKKPAPIPAEKVSTGQKKKSRRSGSLTAQVKAFREELLLKRALLLGNLSKMEVEALRASNQDHSVDNMADFGTDNYEQDFTLGLIENVEAVVKQIDEALGRIDQGAYGICEGCSCTIPRARLKAIPYARFCVNCQSELEKT